jgi:hypothetical protein
LEGSGLFLSADLCGLFVILKVEAFLCEFSSNKVTDEHTLAFVTDVALIADVRASQGVITSYHDAAYFCSLKLSNSAFGLRL